MNTNLCVECNGDKTLGECECPLNLDELNNVLDVELSMKVIQIQDLQNKINASNVFRAMDTGDILIQMKEQVPHGQWISFIKENLGLSVRTVQNYMRLAKETINTKYYTLGTDEICKRLSAGHDLSV